tara:strand:+ start:512 stop:805 length:294 start_codon:yes stop_codon:yes gene_type:complete
MVQKIVNVIAIASGAVSAAVIASGVFVYVNRDSIIDNIKSQAIEAVGGSLGGAALGGAGGAMGDFPVKNPATAPQASAPSPQSAPLSAGSQGLPTNF